MVHSAKLCDIRREEGKITLAFHCCEVHYSVKVMKKTVFRHGTMNKPGSWAFHHLLLSHCGCQPPGPKSIRAKFASPAGLTCADADAAAAIRRRKETSCAAGPPFGPGGYVPIWKCLFDLCLGTNDLSHVCTESSRHV